ncbi:MAG: hypothetical protein GY909_13915 [Oligoflexia bacterium]|nr:hypothetical protein [Oligoflexia bacterium]
MNLKEIGNKILSAWIFFGELMRKFMATVFLTLIYLLLICPVGIVLRVFNRLQYNNEIDIDTKNKKVDLDYPF